MPSSRDPTPAQMPNAADLTAGSDSVITRSPPGRTVRLTAASPPAGRPVSLLMSCGARGLALNDLDRDERQLAAVVDFTDLDLDLLADLDHVIHVVDPHATVQLADLRDVQQPVPAGQQRHEGTEGGRLHDCAEEPLADLGDVRVSDRVDRGPCRLGRGAVGGADVDGAVVLDGDLGAGVVLDRVDHL